MNSELLCPSSAHLRLFLSSHFSKHLYTSAILFLSLLLQSLFFFHYLYSDDRYVHGSSNWEKKEEKVKILL